MASLLDPPDPDATDQSPVGTALGDLYRKVTGYMTGKPEMAFRYADNPVGTETTQSISMPDPSFRPGVMLPGGTAPVSRETIDAFREGSQNLYDQASLLGGARGLFAPGGASGAAPGGVVLPARRVPLNPRPRPSRALLGAAADPPDLDTPPPAIGSNNPPPTSLLGAAADNARLPPSTLRLNPDAVGFSDRISTRQPSGVDGVHDTADHTVDYDSFNAPTGRKSADNYPDRVNEVIPRHIGVTDPTPEGMIDHMSGNIRALWDAVPDRWKGDAMKWYNGARTLAETMADKFGTSVRAQAGNIAAQSPQRQWEHNVEGSWRTADMLKNAADHPWTAEHEAVWNGTPDNPGFAETNPKWGPLYPDVQGRTLNEISDPQAAALWVRLHDKAYGPGTDVRIIRPDGTFGDLLRNDVEPGAPPGTVGEPAKLQWGNLGAIGNSISVLRNDSLRSISESMGDAHKVRNFYNNIVSPDAGHDITADTHAISAALLRPLGSSNPEVSYGLGGSVKKDPWRLGDDPWPTTMNSAPRGLKGLYPLYAEAYRRVADDLGVLPRQVQSVTWEGIKGLYNDVDRRNATVMDDNSNVWKAVSDGTLSPADARARILARGIRDPAWVAGRQ